MQRNIWKPIGLIGLNLVLYFGMQVVVSVAFTVFFLVRYLLSPAYVAGDLTHMLQTLLNATMGNLQWILLVCVALTTPLYLLIYRKRGNELRAMVGARPDTPALGLAVLFALALNALISLMLGLVLAYLQDSGLPIDGLTGQYDSLMQGLVGGNVVPAVLITGILVPIFEEFLFRGLIQGELRKIVPLYGAVLLQGLLFAISHMNVLQSGYALIIGVLLGLLYARGGNLLYPIVVHVVINSTSVLLGNQLGDDLLVHQAGPVLLGSLALLGLSGVLLWRRLGRRNLPF